MEEQLLVVERIQKCNHPSLAVGNKAKLEVRWSRLSAVVGVSGKSPGLCGRRNREAGGPEVHPVLTAARFHGGVRVGGQRARPGRASAPGPTAGPGGGRAVDLSLH